MSDIIDNIYRKKIGESLKQIGFVWMGSSFINTKSPVIKEISLEKYRWNTSTRKQFWFNLSLFLPTKDYHVFSIKDWNLYYTMVFRKNIGYCWGDENFMYSIEEGKNPENVTQDIETHMNDIIIPVLSTLDSTESLINFLKEENQKLGSNFFSYLLAVALGRLGRLEESKVFFLESIGDKDIIRKTAENLGINMEINEKK